MDTDLCPSRQRLPPASPSSGWDRSSAWRRSARTSALAGRILMEGLHQGFSFRLTFEDLDGQFAVLLSNRPKKRSIAGFGRKSRDAGHLPREGVCAPRNAIHLGLDQHNHCRHSGSIFLTAAMARWRVMCQDDSSDGCRRIGVPTPSAHPLDCGLRLCDARLLSESVTTAGRAPATIRGVAAYHVFQLTWRANQPLPADGG